MRKAEHGALSVLRGLACLCITVLLCSGNKFLPQSVAGTVLFMATERPTLPNRMLFLQSVLAEHRQFDELLFSFSVWIKQFLSELQMTSEINLRDHQVALTRHKVKWILSRWQIDAFRKEFVAFH